MTSAISVADSTREAFPELVNLVLSSESMSDDERQYWISMLPVMSNNQRQTLATILTTERQKLTAISQKYGPAEPTLASPVSRPEQSEAMEKLQAEEAEAQVADEERAADILEEIQDL